MSDCERCKELEELLLGFVGHEDNRCWLDHHGNCQEHGWFGEEECGVARARRLLGLG